MIRDKLWVNGAYRKWRVDKSNLIARNPDNSPTLDDNDLKNYSAKVQWQPVSAHRLSYSHNYNNKIRGHRRDPPPNFVEDQASLVQTNPAQSVQVKYTGIFGQAVFESGLGKMFGVTNYFYQDGTADTDIRIEDTVRSIGSVAAPRHEEAPNSRLQFDNSIAYTTRALGGYHALKAGVQYARLRMHDQFWVNGDMHILFSDGAPNSVRIYNTPVANLSYVGWTGFYVAGFMDARRRHAQHRRPLRSREELDSRADRARGHVHRRSQHRSARADGSEDRRVAARRRLRPAGTRPDRDQGEPQPLRAAGRHQSRHARASVPVQQRLAQLDRSEQRSRPAVRRARRPSAASPRSPIGTPTRMVRTGRTRTS